MNGKDILIEWLKEHGYDGLYDDDDCGCTLDNLMPCESCPDMCLPGHLTHRDCIGPKQ